MPTPNPIIAQELRQAKDDLARFKAEKLRLYPPDLHPFAEPSRFPRDYAPEQIQYRNQLVAQIEELEQRIEELRDRLFQK